MRYAITVGPECEKLLDEIKKSESMLAALPKVDLLHVAAVVGLRAMVEDAGIKNKVKPSSIRD